MKVDWEGLKEKYAKRSTTKTYEFLGDELIAVFPAILAQHEADQEEIKRLSQKQGGEHVDTKDAQADFMQWFSVNYPPMTVISDPKWHAPKIFRQAARLIASTQPQGDKK